LSACCRAIPDHAVQSAHSPQLVGYLFYLLSWLKHLRTEGFYERFVVCSVAVVMCMTSVLRGCWSGNTKDTPQSPPVKKVLLEQFPKVYFLTRCRNQHVCPKCAEGALCHSLTVGQLVLAGCAVAAGIDALLVAPPPAAMFPN